LSTPEKVSVISNNKSQRRFIFKIRFNIEKGGNWHEIKVTQYLKGALNANINNYEYKFPVKENKKNSTIINFRLNSINEVENFKFCYSINLGIPIEALKEKCFKTGKYFPYSLMKFINPLIVAKIIKQKQINII